MQHSQKICQLASYATQALDKSVCAIVSVAALEQYNCAVELVKKYTSIDINEFFGYIALLAVLCWVSQWLEEIIHFMLHTVPRFLSNLCHGKFSLCLLDCYRSHKKSSSCDTCDTSDKSCSTRY